MFDFLGLDKYASESELEDALIARLQDTLREFGCAFVGRQVQVEVDCDEFFIDLSCSSPTSSGLSALLAQLVPDREP